MSLNNWLLASNAIFFVLSGLALTASIAIFLLTRAADRAKDRELRRQQFEASQTIAIANATAETAKAEAANANERVAASEQRVAELNLEIARITTPRSLPENFIDKIKSSFAETTKGGLMIGAIPETFEGLSFAKQIAAAFNSAGISSGINQGGASLYSGPARGIVIVYHDRNDASVELARKVSDLFRASGFATSVSGDGNETRIKNLEQWGGGVNSELHNGITLIVGDKI